MSKNYIAVERVYVRADNEGKLAGPKDKHRILLAAPGQSVPWALAEKLGLVKSAEPAADKGAEPAEDKAVHRGRK